LYRNLGATGALKLARRPAAVLGLAARSFYQPLMLKRGERIVRFVNAHQALVREPAPRATRGHRGAKVARVLMARSTLPMTVGRGSHMRPVSLDLKRVAGGLAPVAPLVPLMIFPDRVRFTSLGISLALEGAHPSVVRDLGRETFEASVFRDTDFAMAPLAAGAEQWLQLRSPAAPQRFRFSLTLPAGASAHLQNDGGVRIEQGKSRLLSIPAASATDALGRRVDATFSLDSSTLILTVSHREDREVAYPVAVDPIEIGTPCVVPHVQDPYNFIDSECGLGGTGLGNTGPNGTADSWRQWGFGFSGGTFGNSVGTGLYVYGIPGNYYPAGSFGEYVYSAPTGAFIQRVDFENTQHTNSAGDGSSYFFEGIYNNSTLGWEPETVSNGSTSVYLGAVPLTNPYFDGGSDHYLYVGNSAIPQNPQGLQPMSNLDGANGNTAAFGMVMGTSGVRPSSPLDLAYMQGATVWLYDFNPPTIVPSSIPASSSVWTDDTANPNHTLSPSVAETGLGVKYLNLQIAPVQNPSQIESSQPLTNACTGDHTGAGYCPENVAVGNGFQWSISPFSYQLPEGQQQGTFSAGSAMGYWSSAGFTAKIDRSPPTQTPSGVLWDDRYDPQGNPTGSSPTNPLTGLSYPLTVAGADAASGVAEIDIRVDSNAPTMLTESCPNTNCPANASTNYSFNNEDYSPGQHTITITTKDWLGQQGNAAHDTTQSFSIYTKPLISLGNSQSANQNDQFGLESFYDYRKVATGAGSYARANLANGNLVWDDVPVVDRGQGLSTFVEVAYNSQHRLGELAPLQNQTLLPTGEYNQIGQGFSVGIDGPTRLNEPLDLSVEGLGRISFTDVDGTRHTFIQDPSNSQHWIAPPGVFLSLRPWSTSDASKAWAITRPDGVTFFFDQAGYETQVEDRQTNTITFQRQSLFLNLQSGSTSSCVVQLPVLGGGCSERVTEVDDENNQRMVVCYYDIASEPGCPGTPVALGDARLLKVEDIVDHAGHDLHFDYDSSANLTSMTVSKEATDPNARRVFSFCYEQATPTACPGGGDATPALGALPLLSDLTPSLFPPSVTQITDPNGNATKVQYCAPGALYTAADQQAGKGTAGQPLPCTQGLPTGQTSPCPTDLSSPLPPALGGLVGLEPKCVVQLTDRGGGQTWVTYKTCPNPSDPTCPDSSGNEIHIANVQGPRTDPAGSGTRPDHWIDTTDVFGRPTQEQDPLARTTLLTWNNTGQTQPANTLAKLIQASGSADQVTTLYSYDQNGRLTDRQGPANTATGSTERQNFREVKIAYQLSAGTLTAPSGADTAHCSGSDTTLCFVSDPTSLTNQDQQTTMFTPDPSNPSDGLVTKITDPAGQSWSTSYDQYGRITSQTDPGTGNGTEMTTYGNFDTHTGLPQTKLLPTDPANGNQTSVSHYAYDPLGNLLAVTDPRNTSLPPTAPALTTPGSPYTTVFSYDALSRVRTEYDSKDSTASPVSYVTKTYAYDPNDNLTSQMDARGNTFIYSFTPMDWLSSHTTPTITQADGTTKPAQTTSFCRDEQGDVTDQVDPTAQPATCSLGVPAATNHATHTVYNGDGDLLVSERMGTLAGATNQITSYAYDNRGDQVGIADPVANNGATIAQAESNAQSATSGTVSPSWRTRTYYDAAGNRIETVQNPNASDRTVYASRNQYDPAGLLLASEDARGPSVTKDASSGEFLLSASPVVADTTVYGSDSRGLIDQVTDPAGDVTQIERAQDGKICAITAPNGPSGVSESNCAATTGGYKTTFSYYGQGWLKQIGLPTATEYSYGSEPMTVAYTRDQAGYPTSITDPRGYAITNTFYDNGELKSTNRPSWWAYDPRGSGTPSPDPNSGGQGQVSSDTPGGGLPVREKTLQEIYKAASSQQNQTFPSDNQAGKFGQVAAQTPPGILPPAGQTSFSYDGNGNLTSVADGLATTGTPELHGTTTLKYDELGAPVEIDRPFDGASLTKTYYGYDADGNPTTTDTPAVTGAAQNAGESTYRTTSSYDGLDRLIQTQQPGSGSTTGPSAAPRTTTYCYALAPANGSSPCTPSGQPSQPIASVPGTNSGQTFAVAQRAEVTHPSNTSTTQGASDNVTYQDSDALGNVIQTIAAAPNGTASASQTPHTTYGYDPIGNQTLILRPLGQPSLNGGTANLADATQMGYDAAARLKTSTTNTSEMTSYSYDHDGNVAQVSAPGAAAGSGGSAVAQITAYVYNGRDLPWRTTTGAGSPADGQSNARTTVSEYDGDGNLIRTVNPSAVGTNGMPVNPYDGSYTSSGTGTDTNGAANLDATIRVYTPTNALTDTYLPWGCNLRPNTDKTACTTTAVADTRRFKEHLTVSQSQLNQVTGITEAYDWADTSNPYTTTYGYQPNNWISTETDAPVDKINGFQPTKTTSYTYDPAGDQTGSLTTGSTAGTANTKRAINRGYWPSGQVGAVCNGSALATCSTDPTITPNPTFNYLYWPSGRQSQLSGTSSNGGGTTDSQKMSYFTDGSLNTLNETVSGTGMPAYDTVYTYDLNGNVATRQQGGQLNSQLGTYVGGSRTYFTYNGDDNETTMNVDGNDATNGAQPHRTFATSYWPSGQPQARTRIQCASTPCTGAPITESSYYNDSGSVSQDTRTSGNKIQTYTYDTDGNRSADETGGHLYNALDQEVQWTRGSSPTDDQANSGTTVSYLLDGTGGLLRQIDAAGGFGSGNTLVPITTWYCSASTIALPGVSGTVSSPSTYKTGCQHDADRVEVVNNVSGSTKLQISHPTANYCYDSLGQLARVTTASCAADDATMQSFNLQSGESASTTAAYRHDTFGNQTAVKAPNPNSSASNPTIDTATYSYDALDRRYAKTEQIATTWTGTATPQTSNYGYIGQSNQIAIEKLPDPKATLTLVPHIYDYNSTGQKFGFWQAASTANPTGVYHTYALDARSSIEALENANNTITDLNRYHYTPYGNLEKGKAQGGGSPTSTTTVEQSLGTDAQTNTYRFEGFYEDSGVATYDLQARNYRPQEGIYTTQDSFEQALGDQALRGDPLTQNLYAFAGGNPTSNIEWDGHYDLQVLAREISDAAKAIGRAATSPGGACIGSQCHSYAVVGYPAPPSSSSSGTPEAGSSPGVIQSGLNWLSGAGGSALSAAKGAATTVSSVAVSAGGAAINLVQRLACTNRSGGPCPGFGPGTGPDPTVQQHVSPVDIGVSAAAAFPVDGFLAPVADLLRSSRATGALGKFFSKLSSLSGAAEAGAGDLSAAARARAEELQSQLPAGSQGRVTMAVGMGRDAEGNVQTIVGTSEPDGYLRPGVTLNPGEVMATGAGHAEVSIINEFGPFTDPFYIGAGRPICPDCASAIEGSGATPASPLRGP
jgi:RHS repeat-associated protein